jgi:hypothetical protein
MSTSDTSSSQIASRTANYELNIVLLGSCAAISSQNPSKENPFQATTIMDHEFPIDLPLSITTTNSQECVGTLTPSYDDVVRSTYGRVVSQSKPMTRMSHMSNVD